MSADGFSVEDERGDRFAEPPGQLSVCAGFAFVDLRADGVNSQKDRFPLRLNGFRQLGCGRAARHRGEEASGDMEMRFMTPSIPAFEQPPRDHLRLNFRRALENVEDAGVAQHARDRIFQRETVAAVDLQGVVRRRPGDARAEQLGHAGFEVAAPALVLGAAGEISDLAGDVQLHRHHRQLVGDARELDQRLAELDALLGVAQPQLERALRHARPPARPSGCGRSRRSPSVA